MFILTLFLVYISMINVTYLHIYDLVTMSSNQSQVEVNEKTEHFKNKHCKLERNIKKLRKIIVNMKNVYLKFQEWLKT